MVFAALLFAIGLAAWTLLEWVIHGLLSHILQTFATPMHYAHHRDRHAVVTIGTCAVAPAGDAKGGGSGSGIDGPEQLAAGIHAQDRAPVAPPDSLTRYLKSSY